MRVSSKEERARGHGVPSSEYHALYAARDERRPSPSTQFWIGRYCGSRPAGTVWIAPMIVTVDGLEPPELPQAYVMTLLLGEVLLQGVRFATPGLYFDLTPSQGLARIWPGDCDAVWPLGKPVDDEAFFDVGKGLNLTTGLPFGLAPWLPATDLPASVAAGSMVELPTPCGEHVVYYPARLIAEASLGIFYWFVTACECDKGYLVRTDRNRVRFKTEGEPADIRAAYDELTGDELYWQDENGTFECKRIPSSREGVG